MVIDRIRALRAAPHDSTRPRTTARDPPSGGIGPRGGPRAS
jgi:hypothetical protein